MIILNNLSRKWLGIAVLAFALLAGAILISQKSNAQSDFYPPTVDSVTATLSADHNSLNFTSAGQGGCLDSIDPENGCARTEYVDLGVNFEVQRIINNTDGGDQWNGYVYYGAQTARWRFPGFPTPEQRNPSDLTGTVNTSTWPSGTYRLCATVEGSITALWPNDAYEDESRCSGTFTIIRNTDFNFVCDLNQVVSRGENANYTLAASVPSGYSTNINVTMASNPAGPMMQTSPVVLSSGSVPPYQNIAVIPTGSLTPQTYNLTFSATDGTTTKYCAATLTVNNLVATADLKFNNSDGPTQPTPSTGSTGTLTWDTANAAAGNSCTGSMAQGADTSSPAWSSAQASANSGSTQSFSVTGLQSNTSYTFRIVCNNQFGEAGTPDTVQVNVGQAQDPTVDLKCEGINDSSPQDGPCSVNYGSSAVLTWESANANGCTLSPDFGAVSTSETTGQNTPNLTVSRTYTITCNGGSGTTPDSDSVTINIENESPVEPIQVTASGVNCSVIDISWRNGAGTPAPQFYRVYHNTTGNENDFVQISGDIAYNGTDGFVYTFQHGNPAAAGNFYAVAGWNGTTKSEYALANPYPIASDSCAANISLSDKDLLSVANMTNSADVVCSGQHEIMNTPNNRLFVSGEVATFRINVCNSGNSALTNVVVNDTLSNLSNPKNFVYTAGCQRQNHSINGSNITFYLNDIPAPAPNGNATACSITFEATITAPPQASSALYRFQNTAQIVTAQATRTVYTVPYLFALGAGTPDRNETPAPQN